MTYLVYDGSFDGLLCVCHTIYRTGHLPDDIRVYDAGHTYFMGNVSRVQTDERRARLVESALTRAADAELMRRLRMAFRSEEPGLERALLRLMIGLLGRPDRADASFPDLRPEQIREGLRIAERLARQVGREVHRMHAFVRFARRHDGTFVADIEPAFDVLDLITAHFVARYPSQRWAIRDLERGRALWYDGEAARVVGLDEVPLCGAPADEEQEMQAGWRTYFDSVDIPARRNPALQQRHVPLRYRRHMTELRLPPARRRRAPRDEDPA